MTFKHTLYEAMKQRWIVSNPDATQQQYEQAMREIARQLGL